MKKVGEGTNAVKNSGYFPACNEVVVLKIEARPGCTRKNGCSSAREQNNNEKGTSKLEQGLNSTVNVDVWFCNDDFRKKNPEGKKHDFCRFPMTLKTIGYPNLKDFLLDALN